MQLTTPLLWLFAAGAAVAVATGVAMLRFHRLRLVGWMAFFAGVAALSVLVLLHLTGRLGPEELWFRAPTFYLASALLAAAGAWWLRRPASPVWRFGLPAAGLACVALLAFVARLDGRSAPIAMLLPTMGTPAPSLSYFDTEGRKRSLDELRGNVVVVNFWATWCTPCRREMPMLSKLQREHAGEGLVMLYVSLEAPEVLAPFLAAHHFDGIHGRLDRAADFYDAGKFYPLSYLISRDGRVAHRWSGRPREEWLADQIAALL
jgi:cytochrome c biogenesis protein CcmG/thiol:disulfide interchange protein DsbE